MDPASKHAGMAVRVEAARSDLSVRDLIADALERWLEYQEDEEELRSAQDALEAYQREGGVAAEEVYRQLAAEARASFGDEGGSPEA